jgi:hypothetical protein
MLNFRDDRAVRSGNVGLQAPKIRTRSQANTMPLSLNFNFQGASDDKAMVGEKYVKNSDTAKREQKRYI